jgi:TonB family protein
MLEVEIDETGATKVLRTVSPLGYGLDENAIAAVSTWRFNPARLDGKPVKFEVLIQVNFHLTGGPSDDKRESQRTAFNVAMQKFKKSDKDRKWAVEKVEELAAQGYPPAVYFSGLLLLEGKHVPQNPALGLERIQQAADKRYGLALQEMGIRLMRGSGVPQDEEKGLDLLHQAAQRGGTIAQRMLGVRYTGQYGVPRDVGKAEKYLRLCAAPGEIVCQYQLGKLLMEMGKPGSRDLLEGIAWMRIAGDQGLESAAKAVADADRQLTADQRSRVDKFFQNLKPKKKANH